MGVSDMSYRHSSRSLLRIDNDLRLRGAALTQGTIAAILFTFAASAAEPKLQVLLNFVGNGHPKGNLQLGPGGVLYGTTSGVVNGRPRELGTVYELVPPTPGQTAWSRVVLHKFQGKELGGNPQVGVVTDSSGALYGTTIPVDANFRVYPGLVYRLTPPGSGQTDWNYTTLAEIPVSEISQGQLLQGPDGTLYGTATQDPQSGCFCGINYMHFKAERMVASRKAVS
jgi:hypothetical protein